MKLTKKLISLLLSILIISSCFMVGTVVSNAAKGDTVYLKNSAGWGNPNCYMWIKGTKTDNAGWPGASMQQVEDNIYSYTVPSDEFNMIIFNGGSDATKTDDMDYPGNNYIYDNQTGQWSIYDTSSAVPVVSSSKKSGATFRGDSLTVTVTAQYADTSSYSVDGGAAVPFTNSAEVTLGAGLPVGGSVTLTVTATNKNGTTTETYTYTKADPSSISDGSTSPALDGKYSTNPNGGVGKKKTISVDGDKSDWDSSMLISQGVANDDPRVYCHWSMHEKPYDDYALYAAWDDQNLYLMYEMANVQDIVAPQDDFPLSQGDLWIDNIPVFVYLYTGEGNITHGKTASGTLWDSGITFDANADHVVAFSTNASNGPFIYTADDNGNLDPERLVNRNTGISIKWGKGKTLSGELIGVNKAGTDNGRKYGDTLDEGSDWVDFYKLGHKENLDMFYEVSIPLKNLDISASDIESNGIGIMKVSTMGTSGLDCQPYDMSMQDNAAEEYSFDPSTSHEKEDEDHITVPFARIGKLLSSSPSQPTTPTPSATTTTAPATQAPTPSQTTPTQPSSDPKETTPSSAQTPTQESTDVPGVPTIPTGTTATPSMPDVTQSIPGQSTSSTDKPEPSALNVVTTLNNAYPQTVSVKDSSFTVTYNLTAPEMIAFCQGMVTYDKSKLLLTNMNFPRITSYLTKNEITGQFNFTGVSKETQAGIYDFRSGGVLVELTFSVLNPSGDANINLDINMLGSRTTDYFDNGVPTASASSVVDSLSKPSVGEAKPSVSDNTSEPTTQPSTPTPTQPSTPTPTGSETTEPTSSDTTPTGSETIEPSTPAPTQPSTPAPTQPSTPAPTQPTNPKPTNPKPTTPKLAKDLGPGADGKEAEQAIIKSKNDKDPKGSAFNLLQVKNTKTTKNSIKITYKKPSKTKKFVIYGNMCGKSYKKLKTTTGKSFTYKKLKKGKYYKFLVMALDKKGKVVSTSKTIHVATKGGKVGNTKKITITNAKSTKTIKKGKTFKLKTKLTAESKKLQVKEHRKVAFESSKTSIAKVSKKGKITAKKKGTCYIYAYAQNGVMAKIKISVK